MVKYFVGTKKARAAQVKIELMIKIVTSPLWMPFWILGFTCYHVSELLEALIDKLDDYLDTVSSFIAVKFFNK